MHKNHSRILTIITLTIFIFQLLLSACNFKAEKEESTSEGDTDATAAAQTIAAQSAQLTQQAAQLTQQAGGVQPATEPPQPAPQETESSQQPPQEPPQEPPPPPPGVVTILAHMDTNCREGPSPDYPRLGALLKGEGSIVHATNPPRSWWFIENPRVPGQLCWVWGETTEVIGDIDALEVIEPPPPPEPGPPGPSFQAFFANIHPCGGMPTATFEVANDGAVEFRSMGLTIEDRQTGIPMFGPDISNAPFMGSDGECPPGGQSLGPGAVGFVGGVLPMLPGVTEARAIIMLCSEPGASGECVDRVIDFDI